MCPIEPVVTGAVRAVRPSCPGPSGVIVDAALRCGHESPRTAALEKLVGWGMADRARVLAEHDPDAAIRAWARKLTDTATQGGLFEP
jgi:hypothetical protein